MIDNIAQVLHDRATPRKKHQSVHPAASHLTEASSEMVSTWSAHPAQGDMYTTCWDAQNLDNIDLSMAGGFVELPTKPPLAWLHHQLLA